MASLFLSYRRVEPDRSLARFLYKYLSDLDHDVFIDEYDIPLGAHWHPEIQENLRRAEWLIALISASSLYNDYITKNELEPAIELFRTGKIRGVLPINVAYDGDPPQALRPIVTDLQFCKWRSPSDDLTIAEVIAKHLPPPQTVIKGMKAFGPADSKRFPELGRSGEVDAFLDLLNRNKPILLHGESGCGKSSFIQAGLFPRLEEYAIQYHSGMVTIEEFRAEWYRPGKTIVVLDQFEQVLADLDGSGDPTCWARTVEELFIQPDDKRLVFSLRDDYRSAFDTLVCPPGRCLSFPLLSLTPKAAVAVLTELLRDARLQADREFAQRLCNLLAEGAPRTIRPAVLQLIAQYCKYNNRQLDESTWEQIRDRGDSLFEQHIRKNILERLPARTRPDEATAILLALVTGLTKSPPQPSNSIAKNTGLPANVVIPVLEQASLQHVRVAIEIRDMGAHGPTYQLTHDLFAQAIIKLDHEISAKRQTRRRLRNRALSAFAILAILLMGGGLLFLQVQKRAEESLKESLRLSNWSKNLAFQDPVLALNLALAATAADERSGAAEYALRLYAENVLYRTRRQFSTQVTDLDIAADGKTFVASTESGVYILNEDGGIRSTFPLEAKLVTSVALSPDGSRVLTCTEDTVTLWTQDARALWKITKSGADRFGVNVEGINYSLDTDVAFAPNRSGEFLVAPGNRAVLYNTEGHILAEYRAHEGKIFALAFSPDGSQVLTGSFDKTARLWDRHGTLLQTFRGHTAPVSKVLFDASGRIAVTGSFDSTVRVWDLSTGKCLRILKDANALVTAIALSTERGYIAVGYINGAVALWGPGDAPIVRLKGHTGEIRSIAVTSAGKNIITASWDGSIRTWDVGYTTPTPVILAHTKDIYGIAWAPDGSKLASASRDGTVKLWLPDGNPVRTLTGHNGPVRSVAFSPDSSLLVSAGEDEAAIIWTLDGQVVTRLIGHRGVVSGAVFMPDGRHVVTSGYDNSAILWDLAGHQLKQYVGHRDKIYSLDVSLDGKLILTASQDSTVKLWDVSSGKELETFVHPKPVRSVIFLPAQNGFATGDYAGTIRLWTLNGFSKRGELVEHKAVVRGFSRASRSRRFASASEDYSAALWTSEGSLIQVLTAQGDHATALAFSPDGDRIAVASKDKYIYVYAVGRDLTELITGHSLDLLTNEQTEGFGIKSGKFDIQSTVSALRKAEGE